MENTTEVLATPSTAESFEAYKAVRGGEKVPATTQPPAEEPVQSETAADTEPAEKTTQEPAEAAPKRDTSLEGRIAQLRAAGKHAQANKLMVDAAVKAEKERADRLDEELRTLRTRKPEEPSKADPPQPQAAKPEGSPKPKLSDFEADPKFKTYGEAVEAYQDARDDWRASEQKREQQAQQQQQRQQTAIQAVRTNLTEARSKYADFDQVATGVRVGYDEAELMSFLAEVPGAADVMYYLGQHPEEQTRIVALSGKAKDNALARIAISLEAPEPPANSEKPKPPVSRAPAPAPRIAGMEAAKPKSASDASSMNEYRRLRKGNG